MGYLMSSTDLNKAIADAAAALGGESPANVAEKAIAGLEFCSVPFTGKQKLQGAFTALRSGIANPKRTVGLVALLRRVIKGYVPDDTTLQFSFCRMLVAAAAVDLQHAG